MNMTQVHRLARAAVFCLGLLFVTPSYAQAPAASDVMALSPGDADIMIYSNAKDTIGPTWQWIQDLGKEPFISKTIVKLGYDEGMRELRQSIADLKKMAGFDPTTDLYALALWANAPSAPGKEDFNVLLVVKGKPVSYTHLRAHETVLDLVCRLLLEKKTKKFTDTITT